MPTYEDHQCPKCGCGEFQQIETQSLYFNISEDFSDKSVKHYFKTISKLTVETKIKCYSCDRIINKSESTKQGKIVLAD